MLIESVSDGWWYSSPLPKDRRVVVFMTDSDIAKNIDVIENWNLMIEKTVHIKKIINGKMISDPKTYSAYSHIIQKIPYTNWLPAGEVASSFDPVSSMGIGYAILSGIYAAKKAHMWIKYGDNLTSTYAEDIAKNFERYLMRRNYYYNMEKRWKRDAFWKRRIK